MYKTCNMYKKFTVHGNHKNKSSAVAFVRMFKECMLFQKECKTDPECLALQRQLEEITRGAQAVMDML